MLDSPFIAGGAHLPINFSDYCNLKYFSFLITKKWTGKMKETAFLSLVPLDFRLENFQKLELGGRFGKEFVIELQCLFMKGLLMCKYIEHLGSTKPDYFKNKRILELGRYFGFQGL